MPKIDYLIVIDLESTCWDDAYGNYNRPDNQKSEIIEIGVVSIDIHNRSIISSESILVRPEFSTVSEFCTKSTGHTQESLSAGFSLNEACKKLSKEYKVNSRIWASWGDYDRVQFNKDCKQHNVMYPFGRRHLNIKTLFAMHHKLKTELSVEKALKHCNLAFEGRPHSGVDDASNIARLLLTILP